MSKQTTEEALRKSIKTKLEKQTENWKMLNF